MKINSERIKSSSSDKTLSIIIPTPDITNKVYKASIQALKLSIKDINGYDIYIVTVEDSSPDFRYSRSVNRGIEEISATYYLNMNDDVLVKNSTLSESIKIAESFPNFGILGSVLFYPDGGIQHSGISVVKAPSLDYFIKMIYYYRAPFDSVRKILKYKRENMMPFLLFTHSHKIGKPTTGLVTAAYHLINGQVVRKIKGYDENYKMGMEDVDFCLETIKAGYNVSISSAIRAIHYNPHHLVDYFKKFGHDTMKYFYSKWDVDEVLNLVKRNGFLYRFEAEGAIPK